MAIDRRLDDDCHHSPVKDADGAYRCTRCGLCLVPAHHQSANPPSSHTIDDLWELIEPKHEPPLGTTWEELEAVSVVQDENKDKRRAEQLKKKGLLPKTQKPSRTRWFDRRWPPELKLESRSKLVRNDANGTYRHAPATIDDNPEGRIGALYGRRDKRLEEAIRQASAETVQLFYEKARLTRRERDIFALWSRGYSQGVIGKQLRVSQQAVGKAVARIREKLEAFVAEMGGEDFLDRIFDRHEREDDDLRDVMEEDISRDL